MATGDTLLVFTPLAAEMPGSAHASFDTRNHHPVIDFDDSAQESVVFSGALPRGYDGGGLTVTLVWAASTASPGGDAATNCLRWGIAVERLDSGGMNLDQDSFAEFQSVLAPPAATSGQLQYTEIALADGAAIDHLTAGEPFRLMVVRQAAHSDDVMLGDAELRFVVVRET